MVRDELCVFMERNHSIGVHGAPPSRSSPPGLCNVNNLAGNFFLERSAHIPPSPATGVTFRGLVGKGIKKKEMMTKVIFKKCFRTLTLQCSLSNIPEFSDEIWGVVWLCKKAKVLT